MIRGAVVGALVVVLAGCGSGQHISAHAEKRTIAQVCKRHARAVATIVGGLVEYRTYMTTEDPAFLLTFKGSGIAERVAPAIRTLEQASGPAGRTPRGRTFVRELRDLDGWLRSPASVPSAVVGDRNAAKLEAAARAVGCTLPDR